MIKHFMVTCGQKADRRVIVDADYYKVENGTLVFRNNKPAVNGKIGYIAYPETVRTFGAGYWCDVESISKGEVACYTDGD